MRYRTTMINSSRVSSENTLSSSFESTSESTSVDVDAIRAKFASSSSDSTSRTSHVFARLFFLYSWSFPSWNFPYWTCPFDDRTISKKVNRFLVVESSRWFIIIFIVSWSSNSFTSTRKPFLLIVLILKPRCQKCHLLNIRTNFTISF